MGMSSREPPATPEAPQAPRADMALRTMAAGRVTGDAQRVGRSQRHDGDGDSRTIHIDGSAQRDGDGIHILIEAQLLAQGPC